LRAITKLEQAGGTVTADRAKRSRSHQQVKPLQHPTKSALVVAMTLIAAAIVGAVLADLAVAAGSTAPTRQSAVQIVRVTAHQFDWVDAGIGAAAGVGLMLALGGGLLITAAKHPHRNTGAEAVNSITGSRLASPAAHAGLPIDEQ
jgi:hypothetical protein